MGLAISQTHCPPTENGNLIVFFADCDGFALSVHAEAVVDVVGAILQPDTAITIHSSNCFDCFFCSRYFDAMVGYLPTAFISDNLAILQSQSAILLDFSNGSDVNHFRFLFRFVLCVFIIAFRDTFVNTFFHIF